MTAIDEPATPVMRVVEPGHRYELLHADLGGHETVQFIEKAPTQPGSTELEVVMQGTTNEAVLSMLIDRFEFLQERVPCDENERVICCLRDALTLCNQRTHARKERGVEGTSQQ